MVGRKIMMEIVGLILAVIFFVAFTFTVFLPVFPHNIGKLKFAAYIVQAVSGGGVIVTAGICVVKHFIEV